MSPKANTARPGMTKVGGSFPQAAAFISAKYLEVGQEIVGKYVDSYKDAKFGKLNHRIELTEGLKVTVNEGTKKSAKLVTKSIKAGEQVILNGNGQLDKALAQVPKGTAIAIAYAGMEEITKGQWKGTEAHQFEVFAAATQAAPTTTDGEEADEEVEAEDVDSDEIPF